MSDSRPVPVSIERRVKQHIHAPVHEWFAPCAPGLEEVLEREVAALGASEVARADGGISFKGKLDIAYQANLWLRTANRVLLRLPSFKARRPEDLFRNVSKFPWEALVSLAVPLRIQLNSRESWLSHEDVVERTCRDAIRRRLEELGLDASMTSQGPPSGEDALVQRLLVRIESDRVQLSLDSSGEHLHRRGYRLATAKAPVRETLAAGMLLLAGYDGSMPLLDPMCGAGTFAIEGAFIARHMPPGLGRRFLFEHWPSFREATWAFLRRKAEEGMRPESACPVRARDLNGGALRATRTNAERAGVEAALVIEQADFFQVPAPEGPGLVVMNPPYGLRIEAGSDERELYRRLGDRLREAYAGWRYAILVPDPDWVDTMGLPTERRVVLPHGGLRVSAVIGRVPG